MKNRSVKLRDFSETMISGLTGRNQIENRRTPQGLDSSHGILSISQEQEKLPHNAVYGKCNSTISKSIESNTGLNTIPKIVTNQKTPELNVDRQTNIAKHNSVETQTNFPETPCCYSSVNKGHCQKF